MELKKLDLNNYGDTMADFHIHINTKGDFSAQEPHSHDYFQLYYVLKGSITHHVFNQKVQLSFGDAFIIPPNQPHYISLNVKDTQFYSCSFTKDFASGIMKEKDNDVGSFLKQILSSNEVLAKICIPVSVQLHLHNLLDFMLYEYKSRWGNCKHTLLSCTYAVLSIILRNYVGMDNDYSLIEFESKKHSVLWCLDYLNNNYTKNISVDHIIKLSRMQKGDFCKLFKSVSGYSFHHLLNRLRINKSVELITSSRECPKFSAIAKACGYNNFSTYYRNFIKYKGISPSEYYLQFNKKLGES